MRQRTFVLLISAVSLLGILRTPPAWSGRGQGGSSAAIKGTVYFRGVKPHLPEISMAQDRVCASEQAGSVYPDDGQVNGNGTLPNVFVYVEGSNLQAFKPPSTPVTLAQRRCEYEPHVLGILVGQTLEVTTEDPTTHNVHVMPKQNRPWNVSQQPGSQPLSERFAQPEIMIPVKCNQHPWMKAYIGVTTNPFFAVTGTDGTFAVQDLPPGQYTVKAWTATFGSKQTQVTVEAGKGATADFTFESH